MNTTDRKASARRDAHQIPKNDCSNPYPAAIDVLWSTRRPPHTCPGGRSIDDIVKECDRVPLKVVQPRPRPEEKRVWASLQQSKEDIFASVADEMSRRDPRHRKTWVCITDGEKALRRHARQALAALGPFILILDLFHVLEYLWDAANALYGKGTDAADAWCTVQLRRLLAGQASEVARGMRQSATKRKIRGLRRKDVDRAAGYFLANKDSMKYHEYICEQDRLVAETG